MKKRKLVLALMLSLMLLVTMIPSFSFAEGEAASSATSGTTSDAENNAQGSSAGNAASSAANTSTDNKAASQTSKAALSGDCGATENDHVTWKLEQNNEDDSNPTYTLILSGSGAITDFAKNEDRVWNDYADQITEAVVDEGITYVGARTFQNLSCKSISFPASLKELNDMAFGGMYELETISLAKGNTAYTLKDGVLFTADMSTLIKYPPKKSGTSYVVPDGVKTLGKHAMSSSGEGGLVNISLPDSLEFIDRYAFSGNAGGNSLTIPNSVTQMGSYAFSSNTTIESVTIGTGLKEIPTYCFTKCSLKTVSFAEGSQVETINGYAFDNCVDLASIDFPSAVKEIGTRAFRNCSGLSAVSFDEGVRTIGEQAFSGCTSLQKIELDGAIESIGKNAFSGCLVEKISVSADADLTITEGGLRKVNPSENISTVLIGSKNGTVTLTDGLLPGPNIKAIKFFGNIAFASNNLCGISPTNTSNWHTMDMTEVTDVSTTTPDGNLYYLGSNASYSGKGIVYIASTNMKDKLEGINLKGSRSVVYAVTNGGVFADNTQYEAATLATPKKANSKFLGWYDNEKFDGDAVTAVEKGKTYYAKWEKKKDSKITLSGVDGKIYDGNEIEVGAKNCTVEGSKGDITFSYQQKDGDGNWIDLDVAPTNAGTYRVKAMLDEDENNASAESGYVEFTIAKADPAYSVPKNLVAIEGQTLADVTLPEGFTWDADETTSVGNPGTNTFTVTYTPADTDNYNTIEGIEVSLKVYMKAAILNEAPVINAEDKTLTVGDKFDPMDGVTATDTEDGDLTDQIEIAENTVDTSKAGLYSVTYKVTDKGGATTQKSINVVVKEKTAPPTTVSQDDSANGAKTGDAMPIGMLAVLMLAAAAGIALCGRKLYKSR